MRCVGGTIPVKGVPMVSEAKVKKFQAIFERTGVMIRIKVVTRSAGTPYADCVQAEECWDILASSESANEVVVRQSFRVFFHSRPSFVASKIEAGLTKGQLDVFNQWSEWAINAAK